MTTTGTTHLPPTRATMPEPAVEAEAAKPNQLGRKLKITGDTVNQATADLPDDQRSAIRRLHAHAWENDLSLADVGAFIGYDASVIHRVFRGEYGGSLEKVVAAIAHSFRLHDARSTGVKLGFIATDLSKKIWQVCDAALEFQRIAYILGESQIGKTTALIAYQLAHNHGQTIYLEVPTGGSLSQFLAALARVLRINSAQNEKRLREDIFAAFDDRMLLIVDEVHRSLPSQRSTRTLRTIEFIRELHDARKCGVVLSATNVFGEAINEKHGATAGILRQISRRRLCVLQLPDAPPVKDLNQFAAAHGLEPATGDALALQKAVIRDEALGMWLCLLRMATKLAGKRKQRLTWRHVLEAHAGLQSLALPSHD